MTKLEAYIDNVRHHRITGEFRPNRPLSVVASQAEAAVAYSDSGTKTDTSNLLCDLVLGVYCSLDAVL